MLIKVNEPQTPCTKHVFKLYMYIYILWVSSLIIFIRKLFDFLGNLIPNTAETLSIYKAYILINF